MNPREDCNDLSYTIFVPGKEMLVYLEGQPVTNILLRAASKPQNVNFNGKNIEVLYNQTAQAIRVGANMSK